MAFKRSAVRLRLAPPLKILSCSNYQWPIFGVRSRPSLGKAPGKHPNLEPTAPRGASAKLYNLAFGS
jgi:hypothetical protein